MSKVQECKQELLLLQRVFGMSAYHQALKELNRQKRTVDHPEKYIRISPSEKKTLYAKQSGVCANSKCLNDQPIPFAYMECDEIVARAQGGTNKHSNRQLLCKDCNRAKSSKSLNQMSKEGHGTILNQLENK